MCTVTVLANLNKLNRIRYVLSRLSYLIFRMLSFILNISLQINASPFFF